MPSIILDAYCDEITNVLLRTDRSRWMYIGVLFVPKEKKDELINRLLNKRCIQHNKWCWNTEECEYKCGYHKQNNTEIHYTEIGRHDAKFRIGHRWIDEFLVNENNKRNKELVYFNILGLNLTNLNLEDFGSNEGRDLTIYNRFFRTALLGGAKYFFSEYNDIRIENIFHDEGSQEEHDFFPWHAAYRINIDDDKVDILSESIKFINSDHREYERDDISNKRESQLIQFIDLILGSIYCCLHAPAKRIEKIKIGIAIKPLLERLLDNPKNPNSSYNYYRKQQVSFFPDKKINNLEDAYYQLSLYGEKKEGVMTKSGSSFFTNRPILLIHPDQKSIFDERFTQNK